MLAQQIGADQTGLGQGAADAAVILHIEAQRRQRS